MRTRHQVGNDDLVALRTTGIGSATMHALVQYIEEGRPTGDFLRAVLSNQLAESFARADDENERAIPALVRWLYNRAPGPCWGSPGAYAHWVRKGTEDTW